MSTAFQALLQHHADAQLVANLDSQSFGVPGVAEDVEFQQQHMGL